METLKVIKPKKDISLDDVREIWKYKELLYFFTWRDFKVRYKQTMIGIMWAIFQPFITMVVFSVFFGGLAKIPSDGVPYPIFVFVGLLFWQFFSSSLSETSNSLIGNASIATKVYFPRLLLPISSILTRFIDFFIAAIILVGLMVYYGYVPGIEALWVMPILLIITFLAALGGGLILSSINIRYRDVRYALPFFIQLLLFVTPVIYPTSIAGKYSWILAMNPITGVIKAARGSLLGTEPVNWLLIGISFALVTVLSIVGVVIFKKSERYFADIV